MDIISFNEAATANGRIEKVIAQPDSVSGLVTMPSVVATGEVISIPTGRTVVHPNLQVDGTLDVQGTLFIPSGGSVSTTEVDATVVKQNGNVVANDSTVVHKTGDETIAGIKTFSSSPIVPTPTTDMQASTKLYTDGKVSKSGDTMTGNLGIGRATSAWDSNISAIEFGLSGCLYGRDSGDGVFFGANYYSNNNNGIGALYKFTYPATAYRQGDGAHKWYVAPSGTAGTPIAWVEAMTLNNSGNVGIGVIPTSYFGSTRHLTTVGTVGKASNEVAIMDGVDGHRICMYVNDTTGKMGIETGSSSGSYSGLSFSIEGSEKAVIDRSGNVLVTGSGGLGYGTGSGGTVTQLTSKSTAVTLNKPCGRVITNNASLSAGASVSFTVNNSLFSSIDTVILTGKSFSARYRIENSNSTTGSFDIRITNIGGVAYTDVLEIDFAVIKGATA